MPDLFRKVLTTVLAVGVLMLGSLPAAYALEAQIDQFVVFKNGNLFVNDPFDDGNPPPTSEAFFGTGTTPVTYNTRGSFSEAASKAILDSLIGFPTLGLAGNQRGEPILLNQATLLTNTSPVGVSTSGLKIDDTIEVRGLFDLVEPAKKSDAYGISLTDRATNIGNVGSDNVRLIVFKTAISGTNRIGFVRADFVTGIVDRAETAPLDPNHAQILLVLTRNGYSAADREIQAKFAYVDAPIDISGGLSGLAFTNLSNIITAFTPPADNPGAVSPNIGSPITIFNGEEYTRALFRTRVRDDVTVARLVTGSPASISRTVDTPSEDFSIDFIYRFETTTGELTVSLGGTPLAVIPAPVTLDPDFTAFSVDVTDGALQGLSGVELKFEINDPNPGATVLIDNIAFPGLPIENFADATLSNWPTQVGNVGVLVVESAEDATVEFDRAKLAERKGLATFHIKGTLLVDPDNSDGLNLPEDVQLSVGGFTQDIPADAFRVVRHRRHHFHFGRYDDHKKKDDSLRYVVFSDGGHGIKFMKLWPDGRFDIWARKVDLGGANVDVPVPFSLQVGNDLGQTEVEFQLFRHLKFGHK